jgi:hypothetical protein
MGPLDNKESRQNGKELCTHLHTPKLCVHHESDGDPPGSSTLESSHHPAHPDPELQRQIHLPAVQGNHRHTRGTAAIVSFVCSTVEKKLGTPRSKRLRYITISRLPNRLPVVQACILRTKIAAMQSPDESNEGQSTLSFMPVNEPRSPPHSKKRRAPHSCDRCRKRKVRCEPGLGDGMVCRRCAEESAQCDYTIRRTHRGSIANRKGKRNSKSVGSVARPGTSSDPGRHVPLSVAHTPLRPHEEILTVYFRHPQER